MAGFVAFGVGLGGLDGLYLRDRTAGTTSTNHNEAFQPSGWKPEYSLRLSGDGVYGSFVSLGYAGATAKSSKFFVSLWLNYPTLKILYKK